MFVAGEHVEVSLSIVDNQKNPVASDHVALGSSLFPPGMVGGGGSKTTEAEARRKSEEEARRKAEDEVDQARERSVAELTPEMVRIEGGCFQMGSPESEEVRSNDERRHRVCVEEFSIGKYEVTFAEYDRFVEATGRSRPDDSGWGRGRRPVINVTWDDARAYASWLSGETGGSYRLPTEAEWEWEYTARAGSTAAYPWGDSVGRNRANCEGCENWWDDHHTVPVGSFEANAWGLHDTVGNVWEWTCSAYDDYEGGEQHCVWRSADGRVVRGGSWVSSQWGGAFRQPPQERPRRSGRRLGFPLGAGLISLACPRRPVQFEC